MILLQRHQPVLRLWPILLLMLSSLSAITAAPESQEKQSLLELKQKICGSEKVNIQLYFDYDRIKEVWFADARLPENECNNRMQAFRNAVQNWSTLGAASPFCRFAIESVSGQDFRLNFGYMYSYLNGVWTMEMRNGRPVVVSLPRPPEPPPYGCSVPD
ncbi:MAG TPA: hypothetical protein DEA96_00130 [Leptospiraceae bacterium]|nr:hypothetical protein [Spirochaetaceae bacterium]HBS03338.1 hypothetical protein [Leptospiraceae bacterium]|tara:strand:+ start:22111 stop:22587 length:477 start_codon:yes stop_codon:yes gene_type:complete